MATHSSTIAWKISWTEEPGRLQSMVAKSRTRLSNFTFTFIDTDRYKGFPGGSVVKNLPAMQVMQVWSLDWKDPLSKEMATHSSILAWEIPWTGKSGGLQSMGLQRVRHDWANKLQQPQIDTCIYADTGVYLCIICMQYIYIHKCIFFAVTYFNS